MDISFKTTINNITTTNSMQFRLFSVIDQDGSQYYYKDLMTLDHPY
eukprot:CAMPEP_0115041528 /NCGR_PEP_ID=MMETSP0216-20121206/45577_1 /TAXON_ID=223996 /ORGANISM="Protocruzia adherens, Strain Boccale" /LENGTH=45 /DNA_ID= /DNA_START= /DNA_END= /DNA_ORIENTATION=